MNDSANFRTIEIFDKINFRRKIGAKIERLGFEDFNVPVAHVLAVALKSESPLLFRLEPHQRLAGPSPIFVEN